MDLQRAQSVAFAAAIVFGVLALGASSGFTPIPSGFPQAAPYLFVALLVLGYWLGQLAVARRREVEEERWRIVADSSLTSGERDLAHREAERELRVSTGTFLIAGLALGAWLAYQLKLEDEFSLAELLTLAPLPGFGLGLLMASRKSAGDEALGPLEAAPDESDTRSRLRLVKPDSEDNSNLES